MPGNPYNRIEENLHVKTSLDRLIVSKLLSYYYLIYYSFRYNKIPGLWQTDADRNRAVDSIALARRRAGKHTDNSDYI